MTLLQRDREKYAEGITEGATKATIRAIKNMLKYGVPKEKILHDYSLQDVEAAEKELRMSETI